jgi:hypothetical protein
MNPEPKRRRLPSHGTVIAYVALFLAVCGSGYAASRVGGGVKVTCRATRSHKRVACSVVGTTSGPRGPQGPKGTDGKNGTNGTNGNPGGDGPTVFTQQPAYAADPTNVSGYLIPFVGPTPNRFGEDQFTVAEDTAVDNDRQNSVYIPLQSTSQVGGTPTHLSSVQFCINISPNTNTSYHGTSTVSLDKATVYELNEPKPAGGANTGTAGSPPAYSAPVTLVQQSFSGQVDIDDCPTVTASTPPAVDPTGYLYLELTVGLTTTGAMSGQFGTNSIQFGRVTTTYTP